MIGYNYEVRNGTNSYGHFWYIKKSYLEADVMKINLIFLPGCCQGQIPGPCVLREWPLIVFLKMFICLTKF